MPENNKVNGIRLPKNNAIPSPLFRLFVIIFSRTPNTVIDPNKINIIET